MYFPWPPHSFKFKLILTHAHKSASSPLHSFSILIRCVFPKHAPFSHSTSRGGSFNHPQFTTLASCLLSAGLFCCGCQNFPPPPRPPPFVHLLGWSQGYLLIAVDILVWRFKCWSVYVVGDHVISVMPTLGFVMQILCYVMVGYTDKSVITCRAISPN